MLSRSSSIADISLPNCFKLSAITCSSSVCVDPIHSKLKSFKLLASVLWHLDRSAIIRKIYSIVIFFIFSFYIIFLSIRNKCRINILCCDRAVIVCFFILFYILCYSHILFSDCCCIVIIIIIHECSTQGHLL
jgi:hypothetical protein